MEKIVVRRLQVLKYTDKSLISHTLVKSMVSVLVVMWGTNVTFFCLSQICSLNHFGLFKFILFCALTSDAYVNGVVVPNWLNNPLLWDDRCMGFYMGLWWVLGDGSFNLKYVPSVMSETTLIVGIWISRNQLLGQLPKCSCSAISYVFLDALRMQLG